MGVDIYTANGTWVCPSNGTADIEVWGGGGAAGYAQGLKNTTAGAGGGAFAKKALFTVTSGTSYTVTVGSGGTIDASGNGLNGGDSWWNTSGTVFAQGGYGVASGDSLGFGSGGLVANCIGDTKYAGGNGGVGGSDKASSGGGGGSGAGRDSAGNNGANDMAGNVPSAGGAATNGGGAGGNGGTSDGVNAATNGSNPGGGGGGHAPSFTAGGLGSGGKIIITYPGVSGSAAIRMLTLLGVGT